MEYDIAKLSPSMSRARVADNHAVGIIRLAKKAMNLNSELLSQIMDAPVAAPSGDVGGEIDIQI